jgi:GTPase KRas protein
VEKIVERVLLVKDEASLSSPDGSYGRPGGSARGGPGARIRTPIVIVGNKRDQVNDREVSTDEGRALASHLGCEFFETSARLNQNVESAFKALVRQIKIAKRGPEAPGSTGGPTQSGTPTPKQKKPRKCIVL